MKNWKNWRKVGFCFITGCFNPHKAGLFEGSFSWMEVGGGGGDGEEGGWVN